MATGYISSITLPDNQIYDIQIPLIIGTQTVKTGTWLGNAPTITSLYDGLTIKYFLNRDPDGNATLNLTLADGSKTGNIACYYNSGRLSTHYAVGSIITLTYFSAGSIAINGTATTNARWIADANYDSNSVGYTIRYNSGTFITKTALNKYKLLLQFDETSFVPASITDSTGTNKSDITQSNFLIFGDYCYYASNTVRAVNEAVPAGNTWLQYTLDLQYSFNTGTSLTTNKDVYLVAKPNNDGIHAILRNPTAQGNNAKATATGAQAGPITQTLPSSDDGFIYIRLGHAYSTSQITLTLNHPVYWYKNDAIREYSSDAATVNGLTVQTAVPEEAVFTDTIQYHTSGTWGGTNNLKYTATSVNNADELSFTLATASTSAYGVTKLSAAANNSELAATAKSVYDLDVKVDGLLAAANAMTFKGTLGTGGTITTLPATHEAGDTYRVITDGTYAGKYCEEGTLIICVNNGTTDVDADWTSVETNEDGAVIGPTNSNDTEIAVFNGTTGRIIKNSSVTIDSEGNISGNANTATTLQTAVNLWGNSFNGSASIDGNIVFGNEKQTIFKITRKKDNGGGWAYHPLIIKDNAGEIFARFSVYGQNNIMSYIFIGANSYDGNNLRITPAGEVRIPVTTTSTSTSSGALTVGGGIGALGQVTALRLAANGSNTSYSLYVNGSSYLNGSAISKDYTHYNSNNIADATLIMEIRGKKPTVTTTDGTTTYSGAEVGKITLTLGNNKIGANNANGVDDNAQGYLQLYDSSTNVAKLTAYSIRIYPETGLAIPIDKVGILFRPNSSSYYTHVSYETSGNEALVFATQNTVTSFIFVNGEPLNKVANSRWQQLDGSGASGKGNAPGLQIKNNCVSIGELIANGNNPSYKLNVNGTTNLNGDTTINGTVIANLLNVASHTSSALDASAGINIVNGTTSIGHLGGNSNANAIGLYSYSLIYIRPGNNSMSTTYGTIMSYNAFYPADTSHNLSLGTSSSSWNGVYSTTGNFTTGNNYGSDNAILSITNNRTTANFTASKLYCGISYLVPNAADNTGSYFILGKAATKNNAAIIKYYHIADGNDSNYLGLGLHTVDDIIKIYGSGMVEITTTTASSSNSTGTLVVKGGIATQAASYFTGSVHITGTASTNPLFVRGIAGSGSSGDRDATAGNQELYLNYTGGKVQVGFANNTTTNMLKIAYTTVSSSTSTGALVVDGGAGIAGTLYVGTGANITGQTVITRTDAVSATGESSQLIIKNTTAANNVGIELIRGSSVTTSYTCWQMINKGGYLQFMSNYDANGSASDTAYNRQVLKLYPNTGNADLTGIATIAKIKIGTGTADAQKRTISVTDTNLIFNAPTNYGFIFQENAVTKVRLMANKFYPDTTNTGSLGQTANRWGALYVGTADSYGNAYTPVYWNEGVPAPVSVVRMIEWTFDSGSTGTTLSSDSFTTNTIVIQIVVRTNESNLTGPINWQSNDRAIILSTTATSGTVGGYVIVAEGLVDSSITSSSITPTSNTVQYPLANGVEF